MSLVSFFPLFFNEPCMHAFSQSPVLVFLIIMTGDM